MSRIAIVGGQLVTPSGVETGTVVLRDGTIERVIPGTTVDGVVDVVDASGLYVSPGFIDLQCNGAHGIDLTAEPEGLWDLARVLPEYGVTAFLPTIVSSPPAVVERALAALHARPRGFCGSEPLGLHVEGPMLNPERRGAHSRQHLRLPSMSLAAGWTRDRGVVMVTLAPELPGSLEVVRKLSEDGVVVSAGHTDASTEEMLAGLDAGITAVTHLFNAMTPFVHREPGPVGVALADRRVVAGLIVDGVHVHPVAVAGAHAALGPDRLALVTDAVAALGVSGGGNGARTHDGRLMGSIMPMDQALRNLMQFCGCSPEAAIASATSTPARLISAGRKGMIAPGSDADLVLLTAKLEVTATVIGGRIGFERLN